ncbi:MAG: MerR family transcriptional regulator [Lewinellaceae bacterium]|nr:MerR family transcriptional regulator [Lewinellaceae bacterium]
MNTPTYIPVETLCLHYQIEIAFLDRLLELQLIEVQTIEETICIHEDHLSDLERIIRLRDDLGLDPDNLDIVLHLLRKVEHLQKEVGRLQSRLRLYE